MVKIAKGSLSPKESKTDKNTKHSIFLEMFFKPFFGGKFSDEMTSLSIFHSIFLSFICNICLIAIPVIHLYIKHKILPQPLPILTLHYGYVLIHIAYSIVAAFIYRLVFSKRSFRNIWTVILSTLGPMVLMFVAAYIPVIRDEWVVIAYVGISAHHIANNTIDMGSESVISYFLASLLIIVLQYVQCLIYKETLYCWYFNHVL